MLILNFSATKYDRSGGGHMNYNYTKDMIHIPVKKEKNLREIL